jgi:hypothetical protein
MMPPAETVALSHRTTQIEAHGVFRKWVNHVEGNLGRLGIDVVSGVVAGVLAAPFVAIIDTAITQNAAGTATLSASLRFVLSRFISSQFYSIFLTCARVRSDGRFQSLGLITSKLRNFAGLPWFIAQPTSLRMLSQRCVSQTGLGKKKKTSNTAFHFLFLTSFQVGRCDPHLLLLLLAQLCIAGGASPLLPVLAASTAVNSSAAMAKDRAFARLFGAGPARSLPAASYALWVSRDVLSTAAIFSLPPMLAVVMQVRPTIPRCCRFCIYYLCIICV